MRFATGPIRFQDKPRVDDTVDKMVYKSVEESVTVASQTVRIEQKTHATLKRIAQRQARSMQAILADAVEAYRRHLILKQTNEAYAKLKADSEAWSGEQREREPWDHTLADGEG